MGRDQTYAMYTACVVNVKWKFSFHFVIRHFKVLAKAECTEESAIGCLLLLCTVYSEMYIMHFPYLVSYAFIIIIPAL